MFTCGVAGVYMQAVEAPDKMSCDRNGEKLITVQWWSFSFSATTGCKGSPGRASSSSIAVLNLL